MASKKKAAAEVWPKVERGNHLTVYRYEDGSTKLEWDDEALLEEVRGATRSIKPKVKARKSIKGT